MPGVRGDKRRTIVMSDYLWDGVLGREAQRRSTSRAKVIIDLVRQIPDADAPTESGEGEAPAEQA